MFKHTKGLVLAALLACSLAACTGGEPTALDSNNGATATPVHKLANDLSCAGIPNGNVTAVEETPFTITVPRFTTGLHINAAVYRDDPNTPGIQTYYCRDYNAKVTWVPGVYNWTFYLRVDQQTNQDIYMTALQKTEFSPSGDGMVSFGATYLGVSDASPTEITIN